MKIKGKTFVITGGASGLGAAVTKLLVDNEGNVVIIDLDVKAGKMIELANKRQILFTKADVTKEDEVKSAIDEGLIKFGSIDGCINCAGISQFGTIVNEDGSPHSLQKFKNIININVIGTFNVLRLCAKAMLLNTVKDDEDRGIIINIASIAGYDGQYGQSAYASSKACVIGMTLPIARDLGQFKIRIVTICPGPFGTPMQERFPDHIKDSWISQMLYPKRMGDCYEEFGGLCKHIINNKFLNGEFIRVDAGMRKQPK
eukprot:859982_1